MNNLLRYMIEWKNLEGLTMTIEELIRANNLATNL